MNRYDYDGDEFQGICRFEMNLNSKKQIRETLGIEDTSLQSVLNAKANPIADFLMTALTDECSEWSPTTKKEYITHLILENCRYDLTKVEAKMRYFAGKSFHAGRDMEPFRAAIRNRTTSAVTKTKLLEMVGGVSK